MASSRSKELYQALQAKGYSDDFCRELAYRQLNTDYTAYPDAGLPLPDIRTQD